MMTAPDTTKLNSRKRRPVIPSMKMIGKNTANRVTVVERMAKKISFEPSMPASIGRIPRSMRM